MRSCSGKYGHTVFGGSYIDFTGGSVDISTKRYKLLQTALEGSLNISLLSHFSGHISLSQTVILPCCSTAAQYSHFQHEQPFLQAVQGDLEVKSTRCLPQRFSRSWFSWGALPWIGDESTNIQTSWMGARATPSTHSYLHQPPHFGQKRRFAICGMSPSCVFLHTPPQGTVVMSERSITCGSTPPGWTSCPSNLIQTGHLICSHCPTPSVHCVWDLLELQPDSGCSCTRSTLDPSFWRCHQL